MTVPGLVSTIIPVFNRAALLREAVDSVLAQSYRPIEIVIVDDGSTDETVAVCGDLAQTSEGVVRTICQENAGPGAAREAGRVAARGEFLQFLDSDDLLEPRKFELQVAALRARPEAGVAYGPTRWRNEDGSLQDGYSKRSGEKVDSLFPGMLGARLWDTPAPLYRAEVVERAGGWSSLRHEEDWELDCRVAGTGAAPVFVNEIVAEVRRFDSGHASGLAPTDRSVLRDRAAAHERILAQARRAGIGAETREMQHFSRELFHLARQCGEAGLIAESRLLFELAREASGEARSRGWDFRLYRLAAGIAGWGAAARLAGWRERAKSL